MKNMLYVIFVLNNQEYGIEISFAQEILRIPKQITKIPNMPSYVDGIINLRDQVIPIIDLKKRFEFEQTERGTDNRLLVVNLTNNTTIAFIVDDINEIIGIEDKSIEQLDSVVSNISEDSIKGIGKIEDRLILLLDLSKFEKEIFKSVFTQEAV